jgi:hypothetical protein
MNNQERELTRVGIEALNAALAGLGYPPVGENPEVRFGDSGGPRLPVVVVDKPGVAPLSFMFGYELDVRVGPYSGVIEVPLGAETRALVEDVITRVLRSEVLCRDRWKSIELMLRIPGQDPWDTLRVFPHAREWRLEPRYEPYARPLAAAP